MPAAAGQKPARQRRSLGKLLAAAALGLVLLVLLANFALAAIFGLGNPVLLQADPAAAYVLKPNQHIYRFLRHTDVNEYSMRAPSFAAAKPAGTYRVFLIGDSMTYGSTQVDQGNIFASLLRRELPTRLPALSSAAAHAPVEVLNASASAWAIANETGYLASRGTFSSDLVVLVLNTGDSLQAPATLADVGGDSATVKPACALCEVWTRYLKDKLLHRARKQDSGTSASGAAGTSGVAGSAPTASEMANAAPNLERLERFYQLTQQQHARMGIVFLAMRAYVPDHARASAPAKLVDWAQQHHVGLLDTTSAESDLPTNQITLDGIHFNERGHRRVASYLEQHWAELDPGLTATQIR